MIRNVIFDLGNVLVDVDYSRFMKRLFGEGVTEEKYNSFFIGDKYLKMGYESGRITTEEFIDICIGSLGLKMSAAEFADAFNDVFSEIKPMSEFVRKLAAEKKYNLYLLSNTSPLHFERSLKDYDYIGLLRECAVSYKLHALKPGPEIYQKALTLFNVSADECVFIDDLILNCEGARCEGIKSIQYDLTNHAKFEKEYYTLIGVPRYEAPAS